MGECQWPSHPSLRDDEFGDINVDGLHFSLFRDHVDVGAIFPLSKLEQHRAMVVTTMKLSSTERWRLIEKLVREWRDAQLAIDALTPKQRRADPGPLDRLIAAHNALVKYADEEMD